MKEEKDQTPRTTEEIFVQGCASIIVWKLVLVCFAIMCFLSGCTTTKYVEVPGPTKTEVRHTRDTVEITDTLIDHRETIIREADSATLAKFGIQIRGMEKAWLIQTQQLQREINRLKEAHSDTVHVTDSVPYPVEVPVEKLVEKELTWWQQLRIHLGGIAFWLLILAAGVGAFKLYRKFH